MKLKLLFTSALLGSASIAFAQDGDPLQTRVLDDYSVLEGKWTLQSKSLTEDVLESRESRGIVESFVTFEPGTDNQWMVFGDYQLRDTGLRHTGAGLIAFNPQTQTVTFLEHGARGASVMGTLDFDGDRTFTRKITVARTDRSWHQTDVWTLDADQACLTWTSSYSRNGEISESPSVRYCRTEA